MGGGGRVISFLCFCHEGWVGGVGNMSIVQLVKVSYLKKIRLLMDRVLLIGIGLTYIV